MTRKEMLIKELESGEYVVVSGLDKKTFEWNHGHYFGSGIAALGRAIQYMMRESCR